VRIGESSVSVKNKYAHLERVSTDWYVGWANLKAQEQNTSEVQRQACAPRLRWQLLDSSVNFQIAESLLTADYHRKIGL
jgi:hypothetical protein